jgi:hypothetical protein
MSRRAMKPDSARNPVPHRSAPAQFGGESQLLLLRFSFSKRKRLLNAQLICGSEIGKPGASANLMEKGNEELAHSFGGAACGLATSILTALATTTISNLTKFNLFTLSVWVVVPVGAILVGFAAASGYYFGSLYFHKRATWFLLLQMIVIAAATQGLIYYIEYSTMVLDDGRRVADFIDFSNYLDISLTKAHYRFGRAAQDVGEAGSFGYWMAVFQFAGFAFGGLCVYGFLLSKPVCPICCLYLRPLSKKEKLFATPEEAAPYYDTLFLSPVDGPEFAAKIGSVAKAKVQKGTYRIKTTLHGCPSCKDQLIEEKVEIHNGSDWKNVDKLKRRVRIPAGIDLLSVFRA